MSECESCEQLTLDLKHAIEDRDEFELQTMEWSEDYKDMVKDKDKIIKELKQDLVIAESNTQDVLEMYQDLQAKCIRVRDTIDTGNLMFLDLLLEGKTLIPLGDLKLKKEVKDQSEWISGVLAQLVE